MSASAPPPVRWVVRTAGETDQYFPTMEAAEAYVEQGRGCWEKDEGLWTDGDKDYYLFKT